MSKFVDHPDNSKDVAGSTRVSNGTRSRRSLQQCFRVSGKQPDNPNFPPELGITALPNIS